MGGLLRAISNDPIAAIKAAAAHAPYLARLNAKFSDDLTSHGAEGLFQHAIERCKSLPADTDTAEAMCVLRRAKSRAHLAIAALDLSQSDTLEDTTRRITDFADASVGAALRVALARVGLVQDGLFMAALGKMGAGELNYSSDIDMAVFYDADLFKGGPREPADAAIRVTQETMRMLNEATTDGYVFRTDLRLRPDPSSTPLAISTRRAELYYESVGQNWERMVWIKGRPAAGDLSTGEAFLRMLEAFVWRRHLDYWAIGDVQAIKNMINAKGGDQSLHDVACDVKLGVGGIREIEFFVQTQQIILGGRNPELRVRGTLEGLQKLVDLGVVGQDVASDLTAAYKTLRAVEHRIQMLDDQQTHILPTDEDRRAAVAALCGESSLEAFDLAIAETRGLVHRHYNNLFAEEARKRQAPIQGNLVFTGVDDDPGTLKTLTGLGFKDPSRVIGSVRQWHRARTPATRTPRGRELLTALLPDLLSAMAKTGEADQAFARFATFFEGLRAGVQTLSMLAAEHELMEDLVATLALAPRIGLTLARRPNLLEALLSVSDRKAVPEVTDEPDFETAIDRVRHWHGEQAFLIGHSLLHGRLAARDAAEEWTKLAELSLKLMAQVAEAETKRRYGDAPGVWLIAALGKLGGCDMTAGSDMDLLVIYEPNEPGEGQSWFTRFTQRLITALSTETAQGSLYEVDMRLRPSGRAGPVATSLAAFERYHKTDAWTWEHMALTRLRPITGDANLGARVTAIAHDIIVSGDPQQRTADILDMRQRLLRDKPASGPWDLKMRHGGLLDLEFIVQQALLTAGSETALHPQLPAAINALHNQGHFTDAESETLFDGYRFLQALQQVQRLALGAGSDANLISSGLADRFCRATGMKDFTQLEQKLERVCASIAALRGERIGLLTV